MPKPELAREFSPPAGGLAKLRGRINQAERERLNERNLFGFATAGLVCALVWVCLAPRESSELESLRPIEAASELQPIPTQDATVHIYWLIR